MISEFYNEDCNVGLPNKCFNIIYADPPYGIDFQSSMVTKNRRKKKILNDDRPYVEWLPNAYKSLNDRGCMVVFYRWDVQDEFKYCIEDSGFTIKSQIVWDKVVHGMGDLNGSIAPQHELAFFCTKGKYTFPGKRPKSIYRVQRGDPKKLIHPNEKPVTLYKRMIVDMCHKGWTIGDPFVGSGSSRIACWDLGFDFYGWELDPDYYKAAEERFQRHIKKYTIDAEKNKSAEQYFKQLQLF